MGKVIDLRNKQFGKWKVLDEDPIRKKDGYRKIYWRCRCECGNIRIVESQSLRIGQSTNCGCIGHKKIYKYSPNYKSEYENLYQSEVYKKIPKRIKNILKAMKHRCYYTKNINYKHYGLKGITICEEWLNPENGIINFYNWAISNGYRDTLSIDRIDGSKGYYPENCRWATKKEQSNNLSSNVFATINGQTKTIAQWCEELNIKRDKFTRKYRENIQK